MPVDLFGQMAPIEEVAAALPGVPLIEDAAQTIGARRSIDGEWRMAGEVATIGTFSFFPSKNLGGYGDGGMMVTQDERIASRLMRLRTHGSVKTYFHEEVGYNSRLDALQAAVLKAKLPSSSPRGAPSAARTPRTTSRRSPTSPRSARPSSSRRTSRYSTSTRSASTRRDALQSISEGTRDRHAVYYPLPLHLQPCFAYLGYKAGSCPESERAARRGVVAPDLSRTRRASQLDEVVAAVRASSMAAERPAPSMKAQLLREIAGPHRRRRRHRSRLRRASRSRWSSAKAGFHVIGYDVSSASSILLMAGDSHIQDVPAAEVAALVRRAASSSRRPTRRS